MMKNGDVIRGRWEGGAKMGEATRVNQDGTRQKLIYYNDIEF